ncbi:hypothetical protein ACHAW6_006151 [Cyclotella cf. meneghiniana]
MPSVSLFGPLNIYPKWHCIQLDGMDFHQTKHFQVIYKLPVVYSKVFLDNSGAFDISASTSSKFLTEDQAHQYAFPPCSEACTCWNHYGPTSWYE